MKIGIVGMGHVGSNMYKLFNDAMIYDTKYTRMYDILTDKEMDQKYKNRINECDVTFVCVPTPQNEDGSCNTSAVEEVLQWCKSKLIILRSTVYIGFTREMATKYNRLIVFQPEYYGETVAHPLVNLSERQWLTFGGEKEGIDLAIQAYQTVMNSNVRIYQVSYEEAEMAKYLENAYLATKVIFCNEAYDLCKKMNIDYNQVREVWAVADPRIGSSHTFVYPDNRGFGGSCLPKDTSALLYTAKQNNVELGVLDAVCKMNMKYKEDKQ